MTIIGLVILIGVACLVIYGINYLLVLPQPLRLILNIIIAVLLIAFLIYALGFGGVRV